MVTEITTTISHSVTRYAIKLKASTPVSRVKQRKDDIELALGDVRIYVMKGKGTIGIEVPNKKRKTLKFPKNIEQSDKELPIILGQNVENDWIIEDLTSFPHLLVAGSTGSGKSVFIKSLIYNISKSFSSNFSSDVSNCQFLLIDPKRVELVEFFNYPNLLELPDLPRIIYESEDALLALQEVCSIMDSRYKRLQTRKVPNIQAYNQKVTDKMPYIVIVVDELADLLMSEESEEIEYSIRRLTQLARAVGIHLVLATQRPSTDILKGTIKTNCPVRVAFATPSQVDSRVILDAQGAETLLGKGDMLFSKNNSMVRIQAPFIESKTINSLLKSNINGTR